ncbi:DUF3784 domain-containing protein [Clostridium thermobutyricum]|uniref:DUF3784 domain-containing protein n=1 Tax=Clostridium thermobutyricum DSM 4928 TaxID=1121339 RepID=A0A1V4SVJ8_9CLOT|nr:DUF3784 domain-containing protein [Clostridium thermobutyricum]OPX48051.1 hypothetical protein CLTHE_16230 [Clostridium thermobutyricum DSM 4928]
MNFFIGINFVLGLACIFLGYQIKFKHRIKLINGYKTKNLINKNLYTNWVGASELVIGFLILVTAFITISIRSVAFISITDITLIGILILLIMDGEKKYSK